MDQKTIDETIKELTPRQRKVFDLVLDGKRVVEISEIIERHPTTVSKHLSEVAEKFGFKNSKGEYYSYRWDLIELFAQYRPDWVAPGLASGRRVEVEFPDGPVPLDSAFYIERSPVETQCFEALLKLGALVRISAPKQMGKSSLVSRALAHMAEQQDAKTAIWNLMDVESGTCGSLERFLRSFCWGVTHQLGLENKLSEYWEEDSTKLLNCTNYFAEYILPNMQGDVLVLGIDNLERAFQYKETADDFCALLRSWHEKGKSVPIWENMRLVLSYSSDKYAQININASPLANVGHPIVLSELSLEQIQSLAQQYGLVDKASSGRQPWDSLYRMVGGHPYLVRLAFYHIAIGDSSLAELLPSAPTTRGIYEAHLRMHWKVLDENPELAMAMRKLVAAQAPVKLKEGTYFQLNRMGLIRDIGSEVSLQCELYRLYFRAVLGE